MAGRTPAAAHQLETHGAYELSEDRNVQVTLRADIVPTDSGSRVVVRGTATNAPEPMFGPLRARASSTATAQRRPIVYATKGRDGWKWAELVRFAAAIRAGAPGAP